MFNLHDSTEPRKRRRDAASSTAEPLCDQVPVGKRQKHSNDAETRPPRRSPRFWDELSRIPLCRASLEEFNRRVAALSPPPSTSTSDRPHESQLVHVKQLARRGGPDLSYLRGFAHRHSIGTMSQSSSGHGRKRSSAAGRSATSRTRSSADPAFEQNMIDNGIYPNGYDADDGQSDTYPANFEEILADLRKPRRSLSPSRFSEADFRDFKKKCARASGETSAILDVISIIQGKGDDHRHGADHVFNNLAPLGDGLPTPKPDHYDGALPQSIHPQVRRDLNEYITPCSNTARPAAPNFFVEAKGGSGRADVSMRQVCHYGALGSRAVHMLDNYQVSEPQFDRNARSFSATYNHGASALALYCHFSMQPKNIGGQPGYRMVKLRGFDMTDSLETFVAGAGSFRNMRDTGKKYRDAGIEHANRIARHASGDSPSTLTGSRTSCSMTQEDPSDTSNEEDSYDPVEVKRPRHDASVPRMPVSAAPSAQLKHHQNAQPTTSQVPSPPSSVSSHSRGLPPQPNSAQPLGVPTSFSRHQQPTQSGLSPVTAAPKGSPTSSRLRAATVRDRHLPRAAEQQQSRRNDQYKTHRV